MSARHRLKGPRDSSVSRFILIFLVLIGLAYLIMALPIYVDVIFPFYLIQLASFTSSVMRTVGYEAFASGTSIITSAAQLEIKAGCDGIEPAVLVVAAVIAFPASISWKLLGILGGILLAGFLNEARIISLFLFQEHAPRWFQVAHMDVWPAIFILSMTGSWFLWARARPTRKP